ncbi:hypothetical protein Purlil1_13342 [Purpureocillium lilacinum]|uniref:STAS domain-containing protein n=1 Tax=Purpureocillium lilacinum TaxID=33203 RepID=A0ABR0BED3_PURLI|nr:hypothetical protein Purlil1_13342 [Purpureocillium lilacinum]
MSSGSALEQLLAPESKMPSSPSLVRDQATDTGVEGDNFAEISPTLIGSSRPSSFPGAPTRHDHERIRSCIHASVWDEFAPGDGEQHVHTERENSAVLGSYMLSNGSTLRRLSFPQQSRASVQIANTLDLDGSREQTHDNPCVTRSIQGMPETTSPKSELNESVDEIDPVASHLRSRATPQSVPSAAVVSDVAHQAQTKHLQPESEHIEPPQRARSSTAIHTFAVAANPGRWDRRAIWRHIVVEPVSCLPAVAVGLLLNILDTLSYGMILFPLGKPIFSHLGSAGIFIFYVSTIVAQLIFSTGSAFKGAVGSELVEVVPFFHSMAQKITDIVAEEKPDTVIATTIVAYTASSMMTGLVFYLMGKFKFGFMVGYIPRHILIGAIGGVGWFLVATGLEVSASGSAKFRLAERQVSGTAGPVKPDPYLRARPVTARLDDGLECDLNTFKKLTQADTVVHWIIPLILAILLLYFQSKIQSKYFLPLYILAIPLVFHGFVAFIHVLNADTLRDNGWIFTGPPLDTPWWEFYTLFKFELVRWDAVAAVTPTMLALTLFGILHVPINVPALALKYGEDDADLDTELRLHGYSNLLSSCFGSIQNYVYANTVLFIRSGGDKRLAGYMLAVLTFCVMIIGPSIIGFIPVVMVGTLIFCLGFELLLEALWLPRKKLKLAEYLTVIVIVVVMGLYDFIVGIGVGVLLAFVPLIVETLRVSAIQETYNGYGLTSTVRRNPSEYHYLRQAGQQIYIIKLTGYLFFGRVVSIEQNIRQLLDGNAFAKKPVKFVILDLWHCTTLDYSAGEALNTISRLLDNKGIRLLISSVDDGSHVERSLRAVGLGTDKNDAIMLPNLNAALECCEIELLKTFQA